MGVVVICIKDNRTWQNKNTNRELAVKEYVARPFRRVSLYLEREERIRVLSFLRLRLAFARLLPPGRSLQGPGLLIMCM
jgi:hypothetical protein